MLLAKKRYVGFSYESPGQARRRPSGHAGRRRRPCGSPGAGLPECFLQCRVSLPAAVAGGLRMAVPSLGAPACQAAPSFDAKGIETVRRDTCGAVAKMMERSITILFSTKDLSQVRAPAATTRCRDACSLTPGKQAAHGSAAHATRTRAQVKDYVTRQWSKILAGRVSLADFIFAKEVRRLECLCLRACSSVRLRR
jgi:DNA polymerase elongation subunit (family B)